MSSYFEMKDLEFLAEVLNNDERIHAIVVERDPEREKEFLLVAPFLSEENEPAIKNLNLIFYALENCPLKSGATKDEYLNEINKFCSKLDYIDDIVTIKNGVCLKDRGYDLVLGAIDNACKTLHSLGFNLPQTRIRYRNF